MMRTPISPRLRVFAVACLVGALAGCSTMREINRDTTNEYSKANHQIDRILSGTAQPKPTLGPQISALPYVNTRPVEHEALYPSVFYERASLNAPTGYVWQLLQRVQDLIHIPVHAGDDVLVVGEGGASAPVAVGLNDATLGVPPPDSVSHMQDGGATAATTIPAISYQGTVKGLLDTIAGNLDATWRYDERTNAITFFRYETRTFHIDALPGESTANSLVESGSGGGVQGSQGQTVTISQGQAQTQFLGKQMSVWKSLEASIKPMLSPKGSLSISEPTASVTVRDRWDRVDQIAKHIDDVNRSLAIQVEVNVTVYRVHSSAADDRGLNWSAMWYALGQASSNIGVSIATPRPTATGLSSLVLTAPTQKANGKLYPWAGSKFFLDALSTLGKTSVVTNSSVSTVNNTPVPVKVIHTTAYVAQTTSLYTNGVGGNNSSVVGAGATITPGAVETGFSMQVLPSVQADGHRILLQVMLSLSTLDNLGTFTSGGQTVQLPEVSAREFMQRVWMRSGEALVLAGFQNSETDHTTQSPLDKSIWFFGGNRQVARSRDALVIVITPVASAPQATL